MLNPRILKTYQVMKVLLVYRYLSEIYKYYQAQNYDALGRRIKKTVGSNTTLYYYSGNQVIEEQDTSGTTQKQYIYGNGIDEVIRVDVNESGTMVPYYYHTDGRGNVTAITDNTGNIKERYSYDIYGSANITDAGGQVINQSFIGNEYMFQGRRYDQETNLYYYRARHYDPVMGRFLQTDPMGYTDSMNLYQAFNMNGVNFVDPMGKDTINIFYNINRTDNYWEIVKFTRKNGQLVRKNAKRPDWEYLTQVAHQKGHTLNLIWPNSVDAINKLSYATSELFGAESETYASRTDMFKKSLRQENTWTFSIGHSARYQNSNMRYGVVLNGSEGIYNGSINVKNRYVGIFSCQSYMYVNNLFVGKSKKFSIIDPEVQNGTKLHNLEQAAWATIFSLIHNESPSVARRKGQDALRGIANWQKTLKNKQKLIDPDDSVLLNYVKIPWDQLLMGF
jgi:RHS repeat-associated protein